MKAMRHIASALMLASVVVIIVAATWRQRHTSPEAQRKACIHNQFELTMAKETWRVDNHKTTNDTPAMADIAGYLKKAPECPSGGAYTIGPVGRRVKCSVPEHNVP